MKVKYIGPLGTQRAGEGPYIYTFPYDVAVDVDAGLLDLGFLENAYFVAADTEAEVYVPVPPATNQPVRYWSDGTFRGEASGAVLPVVSTAHLAYDFDPLVATTLTADAGDAALTGTLRWPDGATGTFTVTRDANSAVVSYVLTHVLGGTTLTYTQPTITRNANGRVTTRPAITVA